MKLNFLHNFLKKKYTEFNKDLTNGLVTHMKSQRDKCGLDRRHFLLICKGHRSAFGVMASPEYTHPGPSVPTEIRILHGACHWMLYSQEK
jgi:hypothetical protein